MKQSISSIFVIITALFLLVACSDDGNVGNNSNNVIENNNNGEEVDDNLNDNDDGLEDENNNTEANNENTASSGENIENQTELSFSESGTVITGDIAENFRFEVKPESVEYIDVYEDQYGEAEPWEEIFVKYTATIKNTDDKPFPISKIRIPSLATWENEEDEFRSLDHQRAAFDEEIYLDGEAVTPEDEIAPGEEITVISIFDTDDVDRYYLQYGQAGEQIVTYAQWTINASDFK